MALRARLLAGFCVVLVACGDKPRAQAPSTNVTVSVAPLADAGAAPPAASPPIDAALPKNAAWVASIDAGAFADLTRNPEVTTLARRSLGLDLSALAELGVDPTRSIQIAEVGLSDTQRAALAALNDGPGTVDALVNTILPNPLAGVFRLVIPVKDPEVARTAARNLASALGTSASIQTGGGLLVLDLTFGRHARENLAKMDALVRGSDTEAPPRAANELVHVVFRPSDFAQLSAYAQVETAGALIVAALDAPQKARAAAESAKDAKTILALAGPPDKPAFERVDVLGRSEGKKLVFEVRATPGAGATMPPPDAWKPSPTIVPDGGEGYVTYSRPFVSAWPLGGDPPNVPFTQSNAARSTLNEGLAMATGLAFGVPVFAHLTARVSGFSDHVYAHFDRAGAILASDGSRIDVGLLSKTVSAAEAACMLASKTPCPVAERLKPGAPAIPIGTRFGRLLSMKGTTLLALALADSKAALDALKVHVATADPLEGVLPRELGGPGGVQIPWLTPTQHLALDVRLDGNVVSATLTPQP